MIKVTLVGTGTVSKHLLRVFSKTDDVSVVQVLSSRESTLKNASEHSLEHDKRDPDTHQPDVYIIAVSDDAILSVSEKLKSSNKLVVHTSGCISMDTLPKGIRRGVFYPLQTFSKDRVLDFDNIPICIEAEKKEDLQLLHELAKTISKSVHEISSEKRQSLHLAAVFANNFTNYLFGISEHICKEQQLDFNLMQPLIKETVNKLEHISPVVAQTGPAKRGDLKTQHAHLKLLKHEQHREIYKLMTNAIKATYGKKL